MKQSKTKSDLVLQNEKTVRKSQKHDANLQKNSTLYFQIGLILCLLASYAGLEMVFASTTTNYEYAETIEPDDVEFTMDKFEIYEEPKAKPEKVVEKTPEVNPAELDVVDNDKLIEKVVDVKTEDTAPETKKVLSTDDPIIDVEEPDEPVSILAVQKVPVYPGCESAKTNDARRKCLSEKLGKLIQKKFDADIASELGLSGKQSIYVKFKINKQGEVVILNTRGTHPKLEKEANRVVNKIPQMEPGINDDKPVEVSYMLPIKFNIVN